MYLLYRYVCLIITLLSCGFISSMPVEHNGMDVGQHVSQVEISSNDNAPLRTCPTNLDNNLDQLRAYLTYFFQENNVSEDASQQIMGANSDTLQRSPNELFVIINDYIKNEQGLTTCDVFPMLSEVITDSSHGLFYKIDQVTEQFQIIGTSDKFDKFEFVGRIFGLSIINKRKLDVQFVPTIFKMIKGDIMTLGDLIIEEPVIHRILSELLSNEVTKDNKLTMSGIFSTPGGDTVITEFIPGGTTIPVTEDNKEGYVTAAVKLLFEKQYEQQINAIRQGLYIVIPEITLLQYPTSDLALMISGPAKTISVEVLRLLTTYVDYEEQSPVIVWFWECLSGWNEQKLGNLLERVTGSPYMPPGGTPRPLVIKRSVIKRNIFRSCFSCHGHRIINERVNIDTKMRTMVLPPYTNNDQLCRELNLLVK